MSLSRAIALATPEQFAEIMTAFAKKALAEGRGKKGFDRMLRPALCQMHAAGFTKERFNTIRREARAVFWKVAEQTNSGTPTRCPWRGYRATSSPRKIHGARRDTLQPKDICA